MHPCPPPLATPLKIGKKPQRCPMASVTGIDIETLQKDAFSVSTWMRLAIIYLHSEKMADCSVQRGRLSVYLSLKRRFLATVRLPRLFRLENRYISFTHTTSRFTVTAVFEPACAHVLSSRVSRYRACLVSISGQESKRAGGGRADACVVTGF